MSVDTVGSLLADIATSLHDGLRILGFADKSQWGPDEHEQVRLLQEALDDAKKDFQELALLVKGQFYYQDDRNRDSLDELRTLRAQFQLHAQTFKDWARTGGPINPIWAKETTDLRRLLHRTQCRAAARIFASEQETTPRCLGAFLVYRKQRAWRYHSSHGLLHNQNTEEYKRRQMEELVACNSVGKFERFGDHDIAFVCDFCDGYMVWEDLETMPSIRTVDEGIAEQRSSTGINPPTPPPAGIAHWQATGFSCSAHEQKSVVFAPLAIGNHLPPENGEWQTRLLCPFCDDDYALAQGGVDTAADDEDAVKWTQDERGFEDLNKFREHLEWQHTPVSVSSIPLPSAPTSCAVM